MKQSKIWLLAALLLTGNLAQAGNGNGTGNGGDYLRFIFEEGRTKALNLIRGLRPCAIPKSVPTEVRNWVLSHQQDLVLDLQNTKFDWSVDSNHVCAFTKLTKSAPIELSYEACRPTIKDKEAAARLLIHEITHHFGISNEDFADWASYAISNSQEDGSCTGDGSNDVFSSRYCSSEPMSASEAIHRLGGATNKNIGAFEISTRVRRCATVGGCGEWRVSSAPTLMFYGFSRETSHDGSLASFAAKPTQGGIALSLRNDHPFLELTSNIERLGAWWSSQGPETHMMWYLYDLNLRSEVRGQSISEPLKARCLAHRLVDGTYTPNEIKGDCGGNGQKQQDVSISVLPDKVFQGRVGRDCLWLFQHGRTDHKDDSGNTFALESEVVIHGKF